MGITVLAYNKNKEKKEEKHEIIKKQKHEIKKSRELPRHHRQKTAKKTKTKPSDVTGVANNYSSIQQKQNKQTNKTHLQQYYTLKTIERRLCLLGFVLIFCLCISEKFNQVSFKCHP